MERLENLNQRTLLALWRNDPNLTRLRVDWPQFGCSVDWESEANSIAINTRVKEFILRGFALSPTEGYDVLNDPAKVFCAGLSCNKSIERLRLLRCTLNEEMFAMLHPFFESNHNLLELAVAQCAGIGADGCAIIGRMIDSPSPRLHSLDISSSNISDEGVMILTNALANNAVLKKLELGENHLITAVGWSAFFAMLQNSNCGVEYLDLKWNSIGDGGVTALGNALASNQMLKTLILVHNWSISPRGWLNFSHSLQKKNAKSALTVIGLGHNNIDDGCASHLADSLTKLNNLRSLNLRNIESIGNPGWISFSSFLQNSKLEELDIGLNNVNDDVLVALANGLDGNSSLRKLIFDHHPRSVTDAGGITTRGWEALSDLLCDPSSATETFLSNHTLEELCSWGHGVPVAESSRSCDLASLLRMNRDGDKFGVARRKILRCHFRDGDCGSGIREFVELEVAASPQAIAWLGRDDSSFSLLYRFLRSAPGLFQCKTSGTKRRRNN